MQALLTMMVTWLSINFGLPASYEHPRVEFASAAEMTEVRYSRLASARLSHVAADAGRLPPAGFVQEVEAIYDDASRTIVLAEDWTGMTPAELSVLVHELVHHLQNVGGLKYACPEARERPAYRAQARWLELFGKSLAEEFELDAMTILVRTNCVR